MRCTRVSPWRQPALGPERTGASNRLGIARGSNLLATAGLEPGPSDNEVDLQWISASPAISTCGGDKILESSADMNLEAALSV